MPYCANCGDELRGAAKFCGGCGVPVGSEFPVNDPAPSKKKSSWWTKFIGPVLLGLAVAIFFQLTVFYDRHLYDAYLFALVFFGFFLIGLMIQSMWNFIDNSFQKDGVKNRKNDPH